MTLRSFGVSGPGFSRIVVGIPILPMSWKRAPSSRRLSASWSRPELAADFERHVVIHRAWEDVYSSFASRAFARASTVEKNVSSRLS
jgi:hypothetical protein